MCERKDHEVLCPGVILCKRTKRLRVWVSVLRKALGILYVGMSDMAMVTPVLMAATDCYGEDELQVIEVILPGAHLTVVRPEEDSHG